MSCPGRELLVLLSFITRDHATQTQTAPGNVGRASISNGKLAFPNTPPACDRWDRWASFPKHVLHLRPRLQPCLSLIRGCAWREERMQPNALGGYRYP